MITLGTALDTKLRNSLNLLGDSKPKEASV